MRKTLLLTAFVALLPAPAFGQQEDEPTPPPSLERAREAFREAIERLWVPRHRLARGPQVREAFRDVVTQASASTVRVRSDGRTVALGGIVGPDGWVLTKASELSGKLTVLLSGSKGELDARVVGIDRDHDLAMLKIPAKDLPSLHFDQEVQIEAGSWVATPGQDADPVAVGVVSVEPRKIRHRRGILGIQMDNSDPEGRPGALIVKVYADTGAERAGLRVNDLVVRVNGQVIKSRDALQQEIGRYSPGDEIEIEVKRGQQTVTVKAILTGRIEEMFGPESRSEYQNNLGSRLSRRRFGFPVALQHDTVLKPNECGGPLVNLDGEVVGFNIARAGRTESYAIPTKAVLPLMYELMSGKQTPEEG